MKRIIFYASLMLLVASTAPATVVLKLNLVRMVTDADRIFTGTVSAVEDVTLSVPGGTTIPATSITFDVSDVVKGSIGQTLNIRQYGRIHPDPETGAIARIPGLPIFRMGEEVTLFLRSDSQLGLTSPVGLFQGAFRIVIDPATERKVAVNGIQNAGLFAGVEDRAATLSQKKVGTLNLKKGPVDYIWLMSLVKKLAR